MSAVQIDTGSKRLREPSVGVAGEEKGGGKKKKAVYLNQCR